MGTAVASKVRMRKVHLAFICVLAMGCDSGKATNDGRGEGGAGSMSAGDASADAGDVCMALEIQFEAAFEEARTCDPNASDQCRDSASSSLSCGACPTHIQDSARLYDLGRAWVAAGCKRDPTCPVFLCPAPSVGKCVVADGGDGGGTCIEDYSTSAP